MNRIGAVVLIANGFYSLYIHDFTQFLASLGWAAALVNRAELQDHFRKSSTKTPQQ